MAKIGIMGGTFNPIHNAHLIMAEEARQQFHLKQVLFMPSKNPPHKKKKNIASDEHRKRMIEHAIESNPSFAFSDLELVREGTTYTRDTIEQLRELYPDDKIYFIVGGDSLAAMEEWRQPEYIFKNCHVLAANRDHADEKEIRKWFGHYRKKYGAKLSEIEMPSISVSSGMIRKKLAEGGSITNYVPDCVERYIRFNGLYGCKDPVFDGVPDDMQMIRYLASCLKPKRLLHTLGVAVTAANMAAVYDYPVRDAYVAGLLHDCAKYFTGDEMIRLCEQEGIALSDVERENTALIHGKLGAHLARTKYNIQKQEMLSAIAYHTTGRPDMGTLEKIIYLADYMEPGRMMQCSPYSLAEIRTACFQNPDRAMAMVLKCCVTYLNHTKAPVDPLTEETYQYYCGCL